MILNLVKRLIKKILFNLGLHAFKRSSKVYLPDDESYRIVARLVGRPDPIIIDGGAHRGDAVLALSLLLPHAQFHCFEPDPHLGNELQKHFKDNFCVVLNNDALGDKNGTATFNINSSRPTNSLLEASDSLQSDLKQLCQLVEKIEVSVTTIDDYKTSQNLDRVDVIKLDLQGYDYNALVGAQKTLQGVKVVLVEALFTEIYRGCHLFHDILALLVRNGFKLYTLCGIHYGTFDELLWADAIFIREESQSKPKEDCATQ